MGETANGRGKLRVGVSAYGRIGVVEGNGASWARLGARFGLANRRASTPVFLCSAIMVFREPRPTIDGQLPTANCQPLTLIHLFPLRVGFALAEELVVVGKLVHQHSDESDDVWTHGVEPLSGFDEEDGGAQETASGDDTDAGIHPSDNRIRIY